MESRPDKNAAADATEGHRVCLVGAGYVSDAHAQALAELPEVETVAVCDTDAGRAEAFAGRHGLSHAFTSIDDAIASGSFDRAHVLVPPAHHVPIARRLIDAGIGVFVEKPMGVSSEECETLVREAVERHVPLGVNHNAVFFPTYLELRRQIEARSLGRLQHLTVVRNLPASAIPPAGHWMLLQPQNMIFESAVHPLSQICDLAGDLVSADTTASGRHDLGPEQHYFDTWQMSLICERSTAQLLFSYRGAYPTWYLVAVCEDGMLTADIEHSRIGALGRSRWASYVAPLQTAGALASQELRQGVDSFGREALSLLGLTGPQDLFSTSMRGSIGGFYRGRSAGLPHVDGKAGARVVAMCEAVARPVATEAPRQPQRTATRKVMGRCDAVLLGGTGFIGRSLVSRLVADGMTVRVLARTVAGLPSPFDSDQVQIAQGDIADAEAVSRAVAGARVAVHLAHGGSFDAEGLETSMIRPTSLVAEACLGSDVERLVFAGSIASLYLGDPSATILGDTPNDPDPRVLGDYGWAKARSEEILLRYAREESLSLCIVRPGIVLGEGGSPLHPGLGQWRGDVHCIGWNSGANPMPLVLVSDVAAAIALALDAETAPGKAYNLVGDVRLSTRECVAQLRETLERPLVFHPRHPAQHQAVAISKWLAKGLVGRRGTPFPSYRMIKSLGCASRFDCSDVKGDLGWSPVEDRREFIDLGFGVHARGGTSL
jgi:predicted dehydrogenase/nucleoside-diphosphate-sugar epimerase